MPYRPFDDQNCSIARTLAIVGERWTLLVLREVLLGRLRFHEIRANTGIATNILSDRLQTLVEHGIVRRRPAERGDGHVYVPTRKGRDLNPVLVALMQWGDRYAATEQGPPRVLVHTVCGHDADPRLHCSHCERPIEAAAELRVRPGPGADARQAGEPLLPAEI